MLAETVSSIQFRLPNYEIMTLDVVDSSSFCLRVLDLKRKLVETGRTVPNEHRIRLMYKREELQDGQKLAALWLKEEPVEVIIKLIGLPEDVRQFSKYDDFVRSVEPVDGSIHVSIHATIEITFGENDRHHQLFVPGLINANRQPMALHEGNMLKFYKGNLETAAKFGYKQWGNDERSRLSERVLLLEVSADIDFYLDKIRYDADGPLNFDYDRGDWRSWQRYTSREPVLCDLSSTFRKDDPHCRLTMTPCGPLQYGQRYAVLLCNNVPTVPLSAQDSDAFAFIPDGVNEDRLFFFSTENRPALDLGHQS